MAEQNMVKDVQDWDLSEYPEKDPRNNQAGSTWFKMSYLTKDGAVDHKKVSTISRDASGKEVQVEVLAGPRTWAVTGGIGKDGVRKGYQGMPSSLIGPEDLRRAEREIGGQPTVVLMGLTHEPVFDEDGAIIEWRQQDIKKVKVPKFWRDVTEDYFSKMRPAAYASAPDPYKKQSRPYTRIQELTKANQEMKSALEAENAELRKQLERSGKKS